MSGSSGYTVRALLPAKFPRMEKAMERARRDDPEFRSKKLPGIALSVAGERVTAAVRDALDTDVFDLIAGAWATAIELRKAADEAEDSPDKTATVFLGRHELTAEVHPVVDITFGALGSLTLRFTLEFTAAVDLAAVTITDHHIVKIGKTEGQARAVLKYGQIELYPPLKWTKVVLHDEFLLSPPLRV